MESRKIQEKWNKPSSKLMQVLAQKNG